MSDKLELTFPISGFRVPSNHGYQLYSAIKSKLGAESIPPEVLLDSINRVQRVPGHNLLELDRQSYFKVRLPIELLQQWLVLSGQRLQIGKSLITVGAPKVEAIAPNSALYAPVVCFKFAKGWEDAQQFQERLELVLTELGIDCEAAIANNAFGDLAYRTIKVGSKRVNGYAVVIGELSEVDSIKLQSVGLGAKRHFGGGFFTKASRKQASVLGVTPVLAKCGFEVLKVSV